MPTDLPASQIQGTMVRTPPKLPALLSLSAHQPLTSIFGPAEDGGHLLALGGVATVTGDAGADAHRPLVGFDAAEVGGGCACTVGHLRVGVVGLGWGGNKSAIIPIIPTLGLHHHPPHPSAPLPMLFGHTGPPIPPVHPPFCLSLPPAWLPITPSLHFDAFSLFSACLLGREKGATAMSIPPTGQRETAVNGQDFQFNNKKKPFIQKNDARRSWGGAPMASHGRVASSCSPPTPHSHGPNPGTTSGHRSQLPSPAPDLISPLWSMPAARP